MTPPPVLALGSQHADEPHEHVDPHANYKGGHVKKKTRGSEVDPLVQSEEIQILSVPLLLPVPLPE